MLQCSEAKHTFYRQTQGNNYDMAEGGVTRLFIIIWVDGRVDGAVEEASAVTRWRQSNQNASFRSATNIVATWNFSDLDNEMKPTEPFTQSLGDPTDLNFWSLWVLVPWLWQSSSVIEPTTKQPISFLSKFFLKDRGKAQELGIPGTFGCKTLSQNIFEVSVFAWRRGLKIPCLLLVNLPPALIENPQKSLQALE